MRIPALNFINPIQHYNNQQKHGLKHLPFPQKDTICFKSRDLLDLPEQEIFDNIRASITYENFLGQGTEAEVYRIKGTDYCVRIPYEAADIYRFNYTKDLTSIDKVNHAVAKLGFGATIMKYFNGVIPKRHQNNCFSRYKLQEQIADMPVKSYTELLNQIANAIDNEMFYDNSGGNLIVDTKNQKLIAIDFYGITDNPRPVRPLSEMYHVLTCYGAQEGTGKRIFDKIIDAGLEEFKPGKIPCMDVALFDFVELCIRRKRDKYLPKAEKLINQIMYNTSLLYKIKKMEIIDKSVSKLLEEKILNLKNITKLVK